MENLDPHAKRLLDMLAVRSGPSAACMTVAERRAAFGNLMRFSGPGTPVGSIEDLSFPGPGGPLPVRSYTPMATNAGPLPGLVYLHGGGLSAGDIDTHDALCRVIANESRCRVIAVDYRLAPEHPFPAAIEDACAATEWVFAKATELGIDANRIGVGGDSAGGTLAALVASTMRARRGLRLAFQLLLCPILDFAAKTPSRKTFETALLDRAMMDRDIALYAAGLIEPSDPRVSPLRARDFAGLPPTFIHTAQCDPLRDEGQIYAEQLALAGVEVHHMCHQGMPHLFYAMAGVIPSTRAALHEIGAEVAAMLAQKGGISAAPLRARRGEAGRQS
jgi:acetyl esterase/lipase